MSKENCEEILMAQMAVFDGEESEFRREELNAHLEKCEGCRREIEEMQSSFALLRRQERRVSDADLWPAIEPRLGAKTNWQPFVFLAVFLVAYKLAEMLLERDPGFAFKIVPFIFVAALFVFLKENPFKINTELILEK
jgi:anti-sigma factor RsiW